MHFVFIPYGKRSEVELLLREMEAQKHKMPMYKGKKKRWVWVNGAIRLLPFGVYEYIFPKENLDGVLATLLPTGPKRYDIGWFRHTILRRIFSVESIPKTWKKDQYVWLKKYVNIIPVGIRHDHKEVTEREGPNAGWTHEAL